ncbi:hypothetical protein CYY_006877 [Polysphondylium violaceum]|uniref:Uncharacterized protein n=1 Tax=Polysphondylium violaceum TaxID=133409 RepID=A0A8J4PYS9_9MYCE|nr:hypothetical protein CYY_006877 [Polysphondylium violaceum]
MGKKNKLKVNLNDDNNATLKNHPALKNNVNQVMNQLLNMTNTITPAQQEDPIEQFTKENDDEVNDILDQQQNKNNDKDQDGDDDMMDSGDDNENSDDNDDDDDDDEDMKEKKLSHREKVLLKRKLRRDVSDLKMQRRKCKKKNPFEKQEKKLISKEIHSKIKATLKKNKERISNKLTAK